jgi:hypothetical protein
VIYTHLAALLLGAVVAGASTWKVQGWRFDALEKERLEAQAADERQQRRFNDTQAGRHAGELATLNTKLGDARARIAQLSGRTCLDAGTVGVLNDTGVPAQRRAAASEPARAPAGAAASDRDVAEYIATCRTRYGEVSEQLNRILDIEDRRHPKE